MVNLEILSFVFALYLMMSSEEKAMICIQQSRLL
ncbi:hypothetical protein CASFOL_019942 [Castilleja foliolosa]|uniref:Uncharacterized protein n=1 Tax=Castilleja foliolosa TaxID=1961234 RepID=A0ABD3D367_9LAMI